MGQGKIWVILCDAKLKLNDFVMWWLIISELHAKLSHVLVVGSDMTSILFLLSLMA